MTESTASNPAHRLRVAIIGGGLSGLAAAWELQQLAARHSTPVELHLFEASPRLGGVFGTLVRDGYRLETGADMFITNKPAALKLAVALGLQDRLIETESRFRRSLILRRGKPVPTPLGFDLMVPRQFGPFLKTPLLSWRGKLRVLAEYFLPGQPRDDESLASFATRRFGREAYERIIQPMIGGIYTADPERLSLQATLPRFIEMERAHGSLIRGVLKERRRSQTDGAAAASGARYGLFLSFDDGMSVLQERLAEVVGRGCTVHLETPVTGLEQTPAGYQLLGLPEDRPSEFDAALVTLPAPRASQLLQQPHPELADVLGQIQYASAAIVVTGHPLSQFSHPLDAFGLVIPAIEQRQILAVSFTSRKFPRRAPAGAIQLRTFVGGALQQQLLERSDDELVAIVLRELGDILGLKGQPELTHVVRWPAAMPQYHLGHQSRVAEIRQQESRLPRLALAGNAYAGVGLPDVIESAQQAAHSLWEKITLPPNRQTFLTP